MNINKWLKDHPVALQGGGAPMGDRGDRGDPDYPYKFHLQLIRMVDWDYDASGTYWGGGRAVEPLYGFMGEDDDGLVRGFVRARSRDSAKLQVRMQYTNARFYR